MISPLTYRSTSRIRSSFFGQSLGGARGDLLWSAVASPASPTRYGSGLIDLATGEDAPVPASLAGVLHDVGVNMLSPDDTLFHVGFDPRTGRSQVERWSVSRRAWQAVGKVPALPGSIMAISDNGSLWVRLPATHDPNDLVDWYVAREIPGSPHVTKWRIHGDLLDIGPGYALYIPYSNSGTLAVYFPEQHRTLRFTGLGGLRTNARFPGVMGTPGQYGPGTRGVVLGTQSPTDAILISTR